jgi:hypothetical protein
LLGDATDDKSLYEEAWKISDYRSSRAQKHWAFYYYTRKEVRCIILNLKKKYSSLRQSFLFIVVIFIV